MSDEQDEQGRFPIRVAARLSGIAAERIRSWETRHAAVLPARSGGGTSQCSAADLERLRLLGRAVASGHRIGDIATLDDAALTDLLREGSEHDWDADSSLFMVAREAIEALDASKVRSLFAELVERMGTMIFARNDAMALAYEIGARWEAGLLPISSEHRATGILRSLLLDRLDSIRSSDGVGPRIIFATPSGERHDLGLLVASVVAASKGAEVVFMGAEVPLEDLTLAVEGSRANVLDLGFVTEDSNDVAGCLKNVRQRRDQRVTLWGGSRGMTRVESISCGDRIEYVDRLQGLVLELRGNDYASTQQPWVKGGTS